MAAGGHEFDGREISPLDAQEIRTTVRALWKQGVRAVALCGVFSPVDPSHEQRAAALVRDEAPEMAVTLSHEIGRMGVLERESAATLNACLAEAAPRTIAAIQDALAALGLEAPL